MAIYIDDKGNLELYQGDSGNIKFSGLPVDKDYLVSFAVKDLKTGEIMFELSQQAAQVDNVTFSISPELTEKLTIPARSLTYTYTYGLKITDEDGMEDTLIPAVSFDENNNPVFSTPLNVTVHQKFVEGNVANG